MLCGCSIVWSSTSEKINSLLLENHPWLLKLQWKIWWKDHCQCCVDRVNNSWVRGGARTMSRTRSVVEFVCGEMLLDLRRTSQFVLTWPGEWYTMEIWYVWVTVCGMCVEEVFYDLQIGFDESQWWCYVSRCYVNKCCISDEGVRLHDGCEGQTFDMWLFTMFGGFASWVTM